MQSTVPQLVDSVELSGTVRSFLSRYHAHHIFLYLRQVFRHSGEPLLRKSYIFLQRPRFLLSIWSSLCIFRFLTNNERRDNWNEAYLRVLFTFNGLCQTHARHLSKESSLSLVLMWQLAPQGNAACFGGVRLNVPFPLPTSFPSRKGFAFRVNFWKSLRSRLKNIEMKKNYCTKK